ncbi:hypothetical protein [Streptomyces sp. NPDC002640]
MPCGTVLDYRPAEEQLQSHAELWLTPLTGVDPAAHGGAWRDVLDHARGVLLARADEGAGAGQDGPLQHMMLPLGMARAAAARGDLAAAAAALVYCEMFALDL